jgi:hypothetical protein
MNLFYLISRAEIDDENKMFVIYTLVRRRLSRRKLSCQMGDAAGWTGVIAGARREVKRKKRKAMLKLEVAPFSSKNDLQHDIFHEVCSASLASNSDGTQ